MNSTNDLSLPQVSQTESWKALLSPAVIVAALGYFVDIYDLLLFNIVRVPSLRDIGYAGRELEMGAHLHNIQVTGLMVGGVLWGMLGDKRGRLSVLFGSIILYSIANFLNAFVHDFWSYAALRLLAGIGLAGELGAGITLVSETLPPRLRGYGTMLVATIGVSGAVVAGYCGELFSWRTCYLIGGSLGFLLLLLRVGVFESGMYERLGHHSVARGNFLDLFRPRERLMRYLRCIGIGIPIWYIIGILVAYTPELGQVMEVTEPVTAAKAIMFSYSGLVLGDFASGALSQWMGSRRKAVGGFLALATAAAASHLLIHGRTPDAFYASLFVLGVAAGYWAVLITIAVEQFGTNLRATAGTSVPNFVRGAVVPMSLSVLALKESLGLVVASAIVGAVVLAIALISLRGLRETYGVDLDYVEK